MNLDDALRELGIDRSAIDTEIRSAFRKEAMIRHPDRNPGAETTKAMTTLNVAFDTAMRAYPFSSHRSDRSESEASRAAPTKFDAEHHEAEMADVNRRANFQPGLTAHADAHLQLLQAAWGASFKLHGVIKDLCLHCGGTGSDGTSRRSGHALKGAKCPRCQGTGTEAERRWVMDFKSPVGATHGQVVVVPGMGGRAAADHLTGDLRVKLHVHPQPGLSLMHDNLTSIASVSVWKWLTGGSIPVMTLEGIEHLSFTPGQRAFSLGLRGWPHATLPSMRGALTVMVKPVLPQRMTAEQMDLLTRFANEDRSSELLEFEQRIAAWEARWSMSNPDGRQAKRRKNENNRGQ